MFRIAYQMDGVIGDAFADFMDHILFVMQYTIQPLIGRIVFIGSSCSAVRLGRRWVDSDCVHASQGEKRGSVILLAVFVQFLIGVFCGGGNVT